MSSTSAGARQRSAVKICGLFGVQGAEEGAENAGTPPSLSARSFIMTRRPTFVSGRGRSKYAFLSVCRRSWLPGQLAFHYSGMGSSGGQCTRWTIRLSDNGRQSKEERLRLKFRPMVCGLFYDLPMRMPVMNKSAPPSPTCRAAENTGVSMNRCRTQVMTPSLTRTTPIAIARATRNSGTRKGRV